MHNKFRPCSNRVTTFSPGLESGSAARVACPLWVKSRHVQRKTACPLSAMCGRLRVGKSFLHVCSLVGAAMCSAFECGHETAGHNALRGSGPGQKRAFDNALAQVGCPDRRIDRLCITCCSPFPTFTSRRMFGAISFMPQARRVPCIARP